MNRTTININGYIGKTGRTSSFSKRASKGTLEVIRKHCPFCGHHKALKSSVLKCARCKRWLKWD
jgi:hypothetical protein